MNAPTQGEFEAGLPQIAYIKLKTFVVWKEQYLKKVLSNDIGQGVSEQLQGHVSTGEPGTADQNTNREMGTTSCHAGLCCAGMAGAYQVVYFDSVGPCMAALTNSGATSKPISYNRHKGTASSIWLMMSGGVTTAATTNAPTIT